MLIESRQSDLRFSHRNQDRVTARLVTPWPLSQPDTMNCLPDVAHLADNNVTSRPYITSGIYWTTTGLIAAVMLWSAYHFGFDPAMKGAFARLGFPDYFRLELTVAKLLGALVLLVPMAPRLVKEFAYHGFVITVVSAIIAHASNGDGLLHVIDPLVVLTILLVSYAYYRKGLIS